MTCQSIYWEVLFMSYEIDLHLTFYLDNMGDNVIFTYKNIQLFQITLYIYVVSLEDAQRCVFWIESKVMKGLFPTKTKYP